MTRALLAATVLPLAACLGPRAADAPAADPQEPAPSGVARVSDQTHAWMSDQVSATAGWLDSFFGSERSDAEQNESQVRLRLNTTFEEGEGVDFKPKAQVRLSLPGTEDRLSLVIAGNANDDFGIGDDPLDDIQEDLEESDENNAAIGAEYFLFDDALRNAKLEAGVRFKDSKIVPRLGARYRHELDLDPWLLRFTERLAWQSDDGFDSKTTVDFDRVLTAALFFRATTSLFWYEDREGLYYYLTLALTQRLARRDYLAYSWINSFVTEPDHVLESVRLRTAYRRQLPRDWAYFELGPELRFPEEDDYEVSGALLVRLDFYFGATHR